MKVSNISEIISIFLQKLSPLPSNDKTDPKTDHDPPTRHEATETPNPLKATEPLTEETREPTEPLPTKPEPPDPDPHPWNSEEDSDVAKRNKTNHYVYNIIIIKTKKYIPKKAEKINLLFYEYDNLFFKEFPIGYTPDNS